MTSKHAAAQEHFAAYDTGTIDEKATVWCGDIENCDVCSRPMGSETYMIDGPAQASVTPMWGNLCVACAFKYSPTIGWGRAQLYRRRDSQWHLIAGGPPLEEDYED